MSLLVRRGARVLSAAASRTAYISEASSSAHYSIPSSSQVWSVDLPKVPSSALPRSSKGATSPGSLSSSTSMTTHAIQGLQQARQSVNMQLPYALRAAFGTNAASIKSGLESHGKAHAGSAPNVAPAIAAEVDTGPTAGGAADSLEGEGEGEAAEDARPVEQEGQHHEYGGPKGPEPTRYGDWEKGGRCSDF